jgi:hypothetical protein
VIPRSDRPTTAPERQLLKIVPGLQRLQRFAQYATRELLHFPIIRRRRTARVILQAIARRHLRRQVANPGLRAKLTPDFEIGCKRILISNDWSRALAAPNVDTVSSGVREVRERSVIAADGSEHQVDTIIFGTGFQTAGSKAIERIHGRDGRSLGQVWDGAPRHYRALSVAGFPNYFRLGGVGCGVGHGSMIFQIESQTAYLVDALSTIRQRNLASVEVTEAAQDAYLRRVRKDLAGTVWMLGGCHSCTRTRTARQPECGPTRSPGTGASLAASSPPTTTCARASWPNRESPQSVTRIASHRAFGPGITSRLGHPPPDAHAPSPAGLVISADLPRPRRTWSVGTLFALTGAIRTPWDGRTGAVPRSNECRARHRP